MALTTGRGGPCSSPGCLPSPFLLCTGSFPPRACQMLKAPCTPSCLCGWLSFLLWARFEPESILGQLEVRKTQGGQILALPGPHCGTLCNQFSSLSLSFLFWKVGAAAPVVLKELQRRCGSE